MAGHLLPAGGMFAFLAEHRTRLCPDAVFADLFRSGRGRPSAPGYVVGSVIVLQAVHGMSDREAAKAVTFDLRWKAACGLPVTAAAFHPTTLTYWRRRRAASDRPQRIFEVVRDVVEATGAVRGRTRRALDSTVLEDAVATQDTVTQLTAAVRRVARALPGGGELVAGAATASGHDYGQPGKPQIAWDDQAAREQLVDGLARDARAVLQAVWGRGGVRGRWWTGWQVDAGSRARRTAARPRQRAREPEFSRHLPPAPADGRAVDRLGHPRPPPLALPRHRQEQPVAASSRRRDQPAPPAQPRTAQHGNRMGAGMMPRLGG